MGTERADLRGARGAVAGGGWGLKACCGICWADAKGGFNGDGNGVDGMQSSTTPVTTCCHPEGWISRPCVRLSPGEIFEMHDPNVGKTVTIIIIIPSPLSICSVATK